MCVYTCKSLCVFEKYRFGLVRLQISVERIVNAGMYRKTEKRRDRVEMEKLINNEMPFL